MASCVGYRLYSGEGCGLGDTIYALSTAFQMVKFSFDSKIARMTNPKEKKLSENLSNMDS
ncbi:hypothetical protein GBA52_026577 [Prunus armeniaca]|nr:hypothetical protein GBA52_026577 [Prunus armeniaca]